MKVVVLCGGLGSRIAGTGHDVPKPMIPIGERPIIGSPALTHGAVPTVLATRTSVSA